MPVLIEEKDIKGCFHNHTDASDGAHSLEDMAEAARRKGWEWYVSGDHSPATGIVHGLDAARLKTKMARVRALDKASKGMRVLCGAEVDILKDGSLDYPDDLLERLDVVVASLHSGFQQSEDQITGRFPKAMENPRVDCIGHLSGRLLGRREAYAFSIDKILDGASRTGVALEIRR